MLFVPKCHCELNFIEMFFGGTVKRTLRLKCDYTFATLLKILVPVMEGVPVGFVRKFARKSWRYMDCYTKGATGRLAEYAVRKYKSHRCVPGSWLTDVARDYFAMYEEEAKTSLLASHGGVFRAGKG